MTCTGSPHYLFPNIPLFVDLWLNVLFYELLWWMSIIKFVKMLVQEQREPLSSSPIYRIKFPQTVQGDI